MSVLDRYKLVVKDKHGKVIQIHEVYRNDITRKMMTELDAGYRVTVTPLYGKS